MKQALIYLGIFALGMAWKEALALLSFPYYLIRGVYQAVVWCLWCEMRPGVRRRQCILAFHRSLLHHLKLCVVDEWIHGWTVEFSARPPWRKP